MRSFPVNRGWLLFTLALALAAPLAATAEMDCPNGMAPTISALRECVQHAADAGLIDDAGVAQSLFAKLDAAQIALDQGQTQAAIDILNAFIYEVQAQSGVHIDAEHAQHMVMHAQAVIAALS